MDSVYRYAALTLIASNAAGADEGFLKYRHENVEWPFSNITVQLRYRSQMWLTPYIAVDPAEDQALSKRAWAIQERYLSPRRILWLKDCIFWSVHKD